MFKAIGDVRRWQDGALACIYVDKLQTHGTVILGYHDVRNASKTHRQLENGLGIGLHGSFMDRSQVSQVSLSRQARVAEEVDGLAICTGSTF